MDEKQRESQHMKKLIAPVVITVIICIYYVFFAVLCSFIPIPAVGKILMVFIPLALAAVTIYVLVERVKEIRSGEEDDLSKY